MLCRVMHQLALFLLYFAGIFPGSSLSTGRFREMEARALAFQSDLASSTSDAFFQAEAKNASLKFACATYSGGEASVGPGGGGQRARTSKAKSLVLSNPAREPESVVRGKSP